MNNAINFIRNSIISGQPIIQVISFEEKRVESYMRKLAEQLLKTRNIMFWDINNGLQQKDSPSSENRDPVTAIQTFMKQTEPGMLILRDVNPLLRTSVELVRKFREAYKTLKNSKKVIIMISPDEFFPEAMKKELDVVYFELPDYQELKNLFAKFLESVKKSGRSIKLTADDTKRFIVASQGLTLDEAYRAYMKSFQGKETITPDLVELIHTEKKQLILKETVLEYFPHRFTLNELGGLDNLKDWLNKRKRAFTKEAQEFGLERPRGILSMGISGCGKSLSAKVIASLWDLPLFRLDMNLVYSGMSGSPEIVFSRALKTMDSVAPAILWIDEIESGISDKHADSVSSRILGYFLTWMQEHTSDIFIAATANRIDLLPAELLRRGRFDQIFFIDLPTRKEREEIFTIHLRLKGNDAGKFNIPQLAQITKGWSGSEIEQVIISAMYEAFNKDRPLEEDDLFTIFGNSVPLSTTMEEQIKKIRSWAHNRAVPASKDKEY